MPLPGAVLSGPAVGDRGHIEPPARCRTLKSTGSAADESGLQPLRARTPGRRRTIWIGGDPAVSRTLRNHNVWLALTYVGLLLLMAKAQV